MDILTWVIIGITTLIDLTSKPINPPQRLETTICTTVDNETTCVDKEIKK